MNTLTQMTLRELTVRKVNTNCAREYRMINREIERRAMNKWREC